MPTEITCAACGKPAPSGLFGEGWLGVTPEGVVLRRGLDGDVVRQPGVLPLRARTVVVCSEECLRALSGLNWLN